MTLPRTQLFTDQRALSLARTDADLRHWQHATVWNGKGWLLSWIPEGPVIPAVEYIETPSNPSDPFPPRAA